MKKKLLSALLALTLILTSTTPAYASDITDTGVGTVPVDLTVETPIFSITVPTSLPITLDEYGEVSVATNATIINGSAGPVKITNIQTKGINGWSITNFAGLDINTAKVGTKSVGLSLNIGAANILTTGADTNNFIGFISIIKGQTLPLIYDAVLPAQKTAQTSAQIAEVIFTVGWDD